jgi:ABC-type lipoprotein export system ATPase subunit
MKAEVEVYRTRDVFTPTTPARVAFVERNTVNDRLVNALTTPGKQIVVYGHSGSGKTTLLVNKLNQVYEQHLTTRCMKGMKS